MSSKCENCGARISCGCQRRSASNGAPACSSCVNSLNERLVQEQSLQNQLIQPPVTDQNTWGANRYKTN
jgi:hypothetical protein